MPGLDMRLFKGKLKERKLAHISTFQQQKTKPNCHCVWM
jgi:hypothetical protein